MTARQRKQKAREAKQALYRQLILEAAERVFAEKGYEDAKMDEIARESGLALGTVYSVVSGKAEVLRAVHESGYGELLSRAIDGVRGIDDPLENVLAGVGAYTHFFLERPDFLRMHLREGLSWGGQVVRAGSREGNDAWRSGLDTLARAFERCIEREVFVEGDPRQMARMMIAMQQVQLAGWIEGGMQADPGELVEEMKAQVVRSFCRAPNP